MTYEQLANELGILLCKRCLAGAICPIGLQTEVEIGPGYIHWRERKMTKPGLRNFLKLVAAVVYSHNRGQPIWQQLWEQNVFAYRIAREHGAILPKHLSRNDRARALQNMSTVVPKPQPAYQWAKEVTR